MPHPFDPGYVAEPYLTLCAEYPEAEVYPPGQFRLEWGPIFHRGRLDGSARVLVIGQDPAQHETVVRRILVGEAGRRVQGFLAKLGITRSYVFINAYLYSVYGSVKAKTRKNAAAHRLPQPLDRSAASSRTHRGRRCPRHAADEAWKFWKATPAAQGANVAYAAVTHPRSPRVHPSGDKAQACRGDEEAAAELEHRAAIALRQPSSIPTQPTPLVLYGEQLARRRPGGDSRRPTSPPDCRPGCTRTTAGPGAPVPTRWPSAATSRLRSRRESSHEPEAPAGIRLPASQRRGWREPAS